MSLGMRAIEEVHRRLERERLDQSIRALELELGLREWDERDVAEARGRLLAQVRYLEPADVAAYVDQERLRLTGGGE